MGNTISVADLEILGACATQVEGFRRAFPKADNGVTVTVENVLKALEAGLDLRWLAMAVFTTPDYVEYRHIKDAACVEYMRVVETAWDAYYDVSNSILAMGDPWRPRAAKRRNRALEASKAEYNRAKAAAWVAAFEASVCVNDNGGE